MLWLQVYCVLRACVCAHSPAAIHSSSSCSSRSTILALSLPEGERKVGMDSTTLRPADKDRGGVNTHTHTHSETNPGALQVIFVP